MTDIERKSYIETIELLIDEIIDMKKEALPDGYCPYAVSNYTRKDLNSKFDSCNDCSECTEEFFEKLKEIYLKEYLED